MATTIVKPSPSKKVRVTINLDEDVVAYFKAKADDVGSYQRLINKALKDHMAFFPASTEDK